MLYRLSLYSMFAIYSMTPLLSLYCIIFTDQSNIPHYIMLGMWVAFSLALEAIAIGGASKILSSKVSWYDEVPEGNRVYLTKDTFKKLLSLSPIKIFLISMDSVLKKRLEMTSRMIDIVESFDKEKYN